MAQNCGLDGCDRTGYARGYCEMHYWRVLRTGYPGPLGPLREQIACAIEDCEMEVDAKALCHGHYQRLLRRSALALEAPLLNQAPPAPWLDVIGRTGRKAFAGPITNAFSLMVILKPKFRFGNQTVPGI